ncbi:MAG: DNA replication and repair protein RecF, partial [Saprospiraceae bacterium]|nr:DNA replication and repair protein RecF [Saprospiraceae bacterium]
MHLSALILTNFKSHRDSSFRFSDRVNLLYGLNGSGKTNVLDAIYCLATTKSYFGIPNSKLITHGASFYRLEGSLKKQSTVMKLVEKYEIGRKKVVEKDGKAYEKLGQHIGLMPVVMITPDDVVLVNGLNQDRRRFVDQALAQTDNSYLTNLIDYNRLLRQRNAFLKSNHDPDPTLLDSYDVRMAKPAEYVTKSRENFFSSFSDQLAYYYMTIAEAQEDVSIVYQSSLSTNAYVELAHLNRQRDLLLKRTE